MKYVIFMILFSNSVLSQNFDKHKWNERVIVINSDKENLKDANTQFNSFANYRDKLIDRKIVVYKCLDRDCTFYNWIDEPRSLPINKNIQGFNIVLIGLDGGTKYTSKKVENPTVIFSLIDSMPMRRQEIKSNNKND